MPIITRIEIFQLDIPFIHPFKIALALIDKSANIIVRIHDSDGLVGIGEGCPASFVTGESPETAFVAAQQYAHRLVGTNPLELDARLRELADWMRANPATRCAYDLALYDLLAKHANLPLYALLGGTRQTLRSNRTIGIASPAAMAATARSYVDAGTTVLKIKLGTTRAEDLARIRAIRELVPPAQAALRLDANQGWDEITAVTILQDLAMYEIALCEQPLPAWNIEGLKRLRSRSPIAIMADESIFDTHDAFRLAALGAVDMINIKLAKSAGIHQARAINAISEAAGISCMLGGMSETLLGVAAGAHLICASPNIKLADLDSPFHFVEQPTVGGIEFYADGRVTLSDAPGHGVDLLPEWLARSTQAVVGDQRSETRS